MSQNMEAFQKLRSSYQETRKAIFQMDDWPIS